MFRFAVLLAVVGCAVAGTIPEGLVPQLDGRIVGGSAASITSFPYQVSLQRNGQHFCGGSLYRANIVVTAAHCLQNVLPSQITVRAGSTSRSSGGVVVGVANFINHQSYNGNTMVNDVAVIRLSSSLTLSSSIRTIGLATSAPRTGTSSVVTGWGTTTEGGSAPTTLQQVNVDIIQQPECTGYSYGAQIRPTMICASAYGKDACQGDSGGPLVANSQLVGIVSWGYGCARPNYPGVYACVPDLHNWIANTANSV